jgi:DNA polymerase sigma
MNKWNLKMSATLTPARLLMGFLDYYSYYFNVSLFGIDVSNNGSFFEHSSPEINFVILDPLNDQNNTTKNSFLTHEIIKSFRKAFNSLKNLLLQYQRMQNSNITDNLLDVILERNQDH